MANKSVEVFLANNQTDHKGKKYIKRGKKLWSLLGKLLNVSNRGTFGFVRIKDVEGLLGAAQNVEEKWLSALCGISELMDGSGQFCEACARRGQALQAGQGWFTAPEGAPSSVRQLLGQETPIKLYQLHSLWSREAFAGHVPRNAVRGSSNNSVWPCEFWGRCGFAPLPHQTSCIGNLSVPSYTGFSRVGKYLSLSSFTALLEKRKSFLGREVQAGILIFLGSSLVLVSSSPLALLS